MLPAGRAVALDVEIFFEEITDMDEILWDGELVVKKLQVPSWIEEPVAETTLVTETSPVVVVEV